MVRELQKAEMKIFSDRQRVAVNGASSWDNAPQLYKKNSELKMHRSQEQPIMIASGSSRHFRR